MPSPHPVSVLIVDDEGHNLLALEAALATVDCGLVTAHSGLDALKCVLAQDFAVIVLDVHMVGMDGFETASLIRSRERSHLTPIIFLTADHRTGARVLEGYRLGAVDYIYAPFDADILRSKVGFFVELFRKSVALEQRTTQLNTMAAELERSEAHFRALIENTSDVMLILEKTSVIRYASPSVERILGYPAAQISGYPMAELLHPDDVAALQADIALLVKTGAAGPPTGRRWRHVDGSYRVLEATATNLLRTMSVAGLVIHARDVTERNQAEEQVRALHSEALQRSEKLRALGQMATGIAHDLNQSLMLVASYSDLARQALSEDPPDLAELDDLLTTTTQAALDGGATVKRLLMFTRSTPDQDNELVDLTNVVREAAQLTAPRWRDAGQAEGRPISLLIEATGHPMVHGSPGHLRALMTNLIFNAVDALPSGGKIRLRVAADHALALMEISDSGIGMTPEVQARVFEPFFTTKGEGGTGLGLAMAFGIVEQHGGHIEVRSVPGDGTTFRMTFPLADVVVEAEPASTPRPAELAERGTSAGLPPPPPLRVLAVDDEPMMTRAVARMLKASGHVVSAAASGEEALKKLAEQPFDVVVSDMGMGAGMNGWELAEAVKRRWPGLRFVLATGWGAALDPAEARAKGVDVVLSKPYRTADLVRALARFDEAA